MADPKPLTGNDQIDADLAELFELFDDEGRLAEAKKAVADPKASLGFLRERIPSGVIRLANALLGYEDPAKALPDIEDDKVRKAFAKAFELVRTHFSGLATHPAVVAEILRELARRSAVRDDGDNTITGIGWEPIWTEDEGKLVPSVLLRLRGESEKLLLASKMDWDDLAFLLGALSRVLQRHMTKSTPIAEAELVSLADAEKITERLDSAVDAMVKVRDLGKKFGIEMKQFPSSSTDQESSK